MVQKRARRWGASPRLPAALPARELSQTIVCCTYLSTARCDRREYV